MSDQSHKQTRPIKCLFSVDVEDWFHILDVPSAPPMTDWESLPSRVERNFLHLLEILDERQVKATCFFLGWIAERIPALVREAINAGHEIASHGYAHKLVYRMTKKEFEEDATKTKKILEDISGQSVSGYRSSGFSVTRSTPWFFDALSKAGYSYDSSIFPAARGHGGLKAGKLSPYLIGDNENGIIEIPISVARLLGRQLCFFGGGYLRLFPYGLIRKMANRVLDEGRPVNFYIHPREIDPEHPRLPMNPIRRFKCYVNLAATEAKIRQLINDFDWMRFCDYIDENSGSGESA